MTNKIGSQNSEGKGSGSKVSGFRAAARRGVLNPETLNLNPETLFLTAKYTKYAKAAVPSQLTGETPVPLPGEARGVGCWARGGEANDEIRMTNDELNRKPEFRGKGLRFKGFRFQGGGSASAVRRDIFVETMNYT